MDSDKTRCGIIYENKKKDKKKDNFKNFSLIEYQDGYKVNDTEDIKFKPLFPHR